MTTYDQAAFAARPLADEEVLEVVARNFIAVIATVSDGQPYAVPIIYGYDDDAFFALLAPGRKSRNMEANPRVCLTIVDAGEGEGRWRSVVVTGRASWVEGLVKLGHALNAIRKQYPGNPVRSAPPLTALKGYHMLRVDVDTLAGEELSSTAPR